MNYLGMYILTKLDSFSDLALTIGVASLLAFGFVLIGCFISSVDFSGFNQEAFNKNAKIFKMKTLFLTGCISVILSHVLPTTKQAAFIYIAPQIIENGAVKDTVKNIPELTKLGTDYLKELLKEKINEQ
jgi:hypothetical protein